MGEEKGMRDLRVLWAELGGWLALMEDSSQSQSDRGGIQ